MSSYFNKKGDVVFAILGNNVCKCYVAENEKHGDRHLKLDFNGTIINKQKSYCFDKEIKALDNLKERLEKSLEITNSRINKLIYER